MEEDGTSRHQISSTISSNVLSSSSSIGGREGISDGLNSSGGIADLASMDVDEDQPTQEQQPQRTAHAFAARLGHAGLSPLVFGDVANPSQEYLSMLFPVNGNQGHFQQANALVAAAAAIQVRQNQGCLVLCARGLFVCLELHFYLHSNFYLYNPRSNKELGSALIPLC